MGDDPLSSARNTVRLILFCSVRGMIAIAAETLHQAYAKAEQALARAVAAEQRLGTLLREFRHRVSNDLQRIIAVLRLQATRNPEATTALRDAIGRVQIIARVHERLSRDAQQAMVDTRFFLHELVADFRATVADLRRRLSQKVKRPLARWCRSAAGMTPRRTTYFDRLAKLMGGAAPAATADAPMLARMAKIGIVPGQPFDMSKLEPAMQAVLKDIPETALNRIGRHRFGDVCSPSTRSDCDCADVYRTIWANRRRWLSRCDPIRLLQRTFHNA